MIFYLSLLISFVMYFGAQASTTETPFDLWSEPKSTDFKQIKKEMQEKAIHDFKTSTKSFDASVDEAVYNLRQSALACFDAFNDDKNKQFKKEFLEGIKEAETKTHVCRMLPCLNLIPGQGKIDKLPKRDEAIKNFCAILGDTAQGLGLHGNINVKITDISDSNSVVDLVSVTYMKPSRCSDIKMYINPNYEDYFLQGDHVARGMSLHELSHSLFGLSVQLYGKIKKHWSSILDEEKASSLLQKINHAQELFADLYAGNKCDYAPYVLQKAAQKIFTGDLSSQTHPSHALRYRNLCYFSALYKQEELQQLFTQLTHLTLTPLSQVEHKKLEGSHMSHSNLQ